MNRLPAMNRFLSSLNHFTRRSHKLVEKTTLFQLSVLMRGLDPRIQGHALWIAGSSPAMRE